MKTLMVSLLAVVLLSWSVGANGDDKVLSGKDFVQLGELRQVTGILSTCPDEEWYCQTDTMLYEVHLGDHDYQDLVGLHLKPGMEAVILGYVYDDDIAVVSITVPVTYQLRTEAGVPLWAGLSRAAQVAAAAGFADDIPFGEDNGFGFEDGFAALDTSVAQPMEQRVERPVDAEDPEYAAGGRYRAVDASAEPLERLGGGGMYWQQERDGAPGLASGLYTTEDVDDAMDTDSSTP